MGKIILFQGAILSKGRTFESVKKASEIIEYSSIQDIVRLSKELIENNYVCYYLFWEKEIQILKNDKYFKNLEQSNIIPIPNKDFPRGKLKSNNSKSKLLHYFAMNYGISYLLSNNLVNEKDILIRTRTDITFDLHELNRILETKMEGIIEGKMLCQYWRKENTRWFIDFIFASNINIMFNLYNKLYINCSNNNDYANSVHQDLIKTLATLYLPKYLIYREGPNNDIDTKTVLKLLNHKIEFSELRFPSSILKKIICFTGKVILLVTLIINKIVFLIYTKYEHLILFFVYKSFIYTMTFKFQKSIIWRGGKSTDNYNKFKKENFNNNLIFSDIKNS
tara:strand:- start:212 stop:1219 length:1008 start_codon:yes stop_codon:yes gene_type:complete